MFISQTGNKRMTGAIKRVTDSSGTRDNRNKVASPSYLNIRNT